MAVSNSSINKIPATKLVKDALNKLQNLNSTSIGPEFISKVKSSLIKAFDNHLNFHAGSTVFSGVVNSRKISGANTLYLIENPDNVRDFKIVYTNARGATKFVNIVCKSSRSNLLDWTGVQPSNNDIVIFNCAGTPGKVSIFPGSKINNKVFHKALQEKYKFQTKLLAASISQEINNQLMMAKNRSISGIAPSIMRNTVVINPFFDIKCSINNSARNLHLINTLAPNTKDFKDINTARSLRTSYFTEAMNSINLG